jgi:hypothetical protein
MVRLLLLLLPPFSDPPRSLASTNQTLYGEPNYLELRVKIVHLLARDKGSSAQVPPGDFQSP